MFVAQSQDFSRLRQMLTVEAQPRDQQGAFMLDGRGRSLPGNWKPAHTLALDLLARQSKDLTVAIWLAEVLVRMAGFAGLKDGLVLIRELHERFWKDLYPRAEDGDLDGRVNALKIIVKRERLLNAVLYVPLTSSSDGKGPFDCQHWQDARIGREGSPPMTELEAFLHLTPTSFYQEQGQLLDACFEELRRLDDRIGELYGDEGISLSDLVKVLEDCLAIVNRRRPAAKSTVQEREENASDAIRAEKGLTAPLTRGPLTAADSAHEIISPDTDLLLTSLIGQEGLPSTWTGGDEVAPEDRVIAGSTSAGDSGWQPGTLDEIPSLLGRLSDFIRSRDLRNPLAYLLIRLFRWSELRVHAPEIRLQLLIAPTSQQRLRLRDLHHREQWRELLALSETCMSRPEGRGWLDLQFYSFQALNHMDAGCAAIARLIAGETQHLLHELPGLIEAELLDGTSAANTTVRQWLRDEVMSGVALTAVPEHLVGESRKLLSPLEEALGLFHRGRFADALVVLHRQLQGARSGRSKFLAQLEISELCILGKRHDLARAILIELGEVAEQRQLAQWEDPEICARLWSARFACRNAEMFPLDGDDYARQLFEQLVRLDITRALTYPG